MAIYFIAIDGDPVDGPVKIGYAANLARRMTALQTGHYRDYVFLRTIAGSPADERRIHARFQHLRIRGEWFERDPAMFGDLGLEDVPCPVMPPPSLRGGPMSEAHKRAIREGVRRSWDNGSGRATHELQKSA